MSLLLKLVWLLFEKFQSYMCLFSFGTLFSTGLWRHFFFFGVVLFCFVFACVQVCLGASVGVFFNEAKQWNITESVALNPGANTGASFHDISV